jgi:hypothetical protein
MSLTDRARMNQVAENVCRNHGHHICLFVKQTGEDALLCSKCGATLAEIKEPVSATEKAASAS